VEYEAVFPGGRRRSVFFHFACYRIWDQERTRTITPDDATDA
jgi:hypothetical protein